MEPLDRTVPAAVEEALAMIRDLATENAALTVDEFESSCMKILSSAGRALMKAKLESLSPKDSFQEDGVIWKPVVHSACDVITPFGHVSVMRPLFRHARNHKTRCRVTELAGLVAGLWTPKAAKLAALAVAEMPMAAAEAFFAEAGMLGASRSSFLRLTGDLSEMWEEDRGAHEHELREKAEVPPEAVLVAASLDGVMVMMTNSDRKAKKAEARAKGRADKGPAGWHEAAIGVVSFYDVEGSRLLTLRYGRMPEEDKTTVKAWLKDQVDHVRRVRPDLKVLAIADGAPNNWTFLESLRADYEVVDFFHTAEHIARHVNKANGASTLDTQEKIRNLLRTLLKDSGAAEKVFQEVHSLREAAGTEAVSKKKTSGKRQPTFDERHAKRMDYPGARAAKVPIGSGVTESTCKLLVCDRLRRTGMRWGQAGGQAVITLRALRVSGQFDDGWSCLMQANRRRTARRLAAS